MTKFERNQQRKGSASSKNSQVGFTNRLVEDAKRRNEKKQELENQKFIRDQEKDKEHLTF
jgi:hypothetical protein